MAVVRSTCGSVPSRRGRGRAASPLAAVVLLGASLGCASASSSRAPRVDAAALAREAAAELERGCYLCLRSAAEKYEAAIFGGARSLELAAAGAWTLLGVRERELGLRPSEALERAGSHGVVAAKAHGPVPPQDREEIARAYVQIASSFLPLREGASTETSSAAARAARELMEGGGNDGTAAAPRLAREAMMMASADHPDPPAIALMRRRAAGGGDPAASYLIESLACSSWSSRPGSARANEAVTAGPEDPRSGLMTFLSATCPNRADPARDAVTLGRLLEAEPRFHEAHFFLGRLALGQRRLVSAEREFLAAADGIPAMTAAWALLGETRVLLEEYEWATADLGRALDLEPAQREALLAHARALNYAGRFEEAVVPARRLLDLGAWYVSDANYWLAFSELQLGRLQDADRHAREAKRTNPMNGDTARLSGLVAQRLAEFDRAQTEFELAVSRNPADCESLLHLGQVHGVRGRFDASVGSFRSARDCYARQAESASLRRSEIDASALSEARKEVARARLAQRVRGYRSAQAAAALGAAEGETQRGAFDQALAHLAEAEADPALNARVGDLRARIAALRGRR